MAVTVETPANIGGSADVTEIRVLHRTGPYRDMVLINKKNDATLAQAFDAGEILIEGVIHSSDGIPPTEEYPDPMTITDVLPRAATNGMSSLLITVYGTNFVDGMDVRINNRAATSITVNDPTSLNATMDFTDIPEGIHTLSVYRTTDSSEPDDSSLFQVQQA